MGDDLAIRTPGDGNVVFVYSCFRAASTWFWSRLRPHRELCCYYEVFNEQLAHLSLADMPAIRPDSWRSHHPNTGPYLTEFASLLGAAPGIPGFPVESPLGSRFLGKTGIEGPLDRDVEAYLRRLIDGARSSQRIPVITCTRLLGRAAGLRTAFAGTHILLVRNLFEQWNSVYGQLRTGNDYFLRMIFNQLNFGRQDKFFSYLMRLFDDRDQDGFEHWIRDDNSDSVFCCYIVSRIYLLLIARRYCDLVVDVTSLAIPERRAATEDALSRLLDVGVDLGNFDQRVDYPKRLIDSPADCRAMINELLERGLSEADASADERDFAHRLVEATWESHKWFMVYTSGARERVADDARHITELVGTAGSLRTRVQDLDAQMARLKDEAAALRQAAEGRRLHAEAVEATLHNCQQDIASLEARVAASRTELEQAPPRQTREAETEREAARAELARALAYVAELEQALDKNAQASNEERAALRAELARADDHARSCEERLVAALAGTPVAEHAPVARALQSALDESTRYVHSLQAAIEDKDAYGASLEAERERLSGTLERAEGRIAALQRRFRWLKPLWPR